MNKLCKENWKERCNFISLCRSPNQSPEEFETFSDNLELSQGRIDRNNLFLIVPRGDLNSKLGSSYKSDSTSYEGAKIVGIT